jgi:hypothetical protein
MKLMLVFVTDGMCTKIGEIINLSAHADSTPAKRLSNLTADATQCLKNLAGRRTPSVGPEKIVKSGSYIIVGTNRYNHSLSFPLYK